jgi:hypothetical protein
MGLELHLGSVCLLLLGLKIRKGVLVGRKVGRDDLIRRKVDVRADDGLLMAV